MSKKSRSDIIYTVSGNTKYNQEDYTVAARHNISVVYSAADLADMDYQNIHDYLEKVCTQRVGFCGYLKRDLYRLMKREGILTDEKFEDVKVRKMNEYLRRSFRAGGVPFSFEGKEVKTDRWLTQKSVSRDVVLLVGFGLRMGPEQVDDYFTKGLNQMRFSFINPREVICYYCYANNLSFMDFETIEKICEQRFSGLSEAERKERAGKDMFSGFGKERLVSDINYLYEFVLFLKCSGSYERSKNNALLQFEQLADEVQRLYIEELVENEETDEIADKNKNQRNSYLIEKALYAGAFFYDENNNLLKDADETVESSLESYYLTRPKINKILKGKQGVSRFDLITLYFYCFAKKCTDFDVSVEERKERCFTFIDDMNVILMKANMYKYNVTNPYECFILLCVMAEDPFESFTELYSYGRETFF